MRPVYGEATIDPESKWSMIRILNIVGVLINTRWDVEEDLAIAKCPVASQEHQERCTLEEIDGSLVQLFVEHWRLPVVVRQRQPLNTIHVKYAQQGNWNNNGHEKRVHKRHIHLHHNRTVSEVHHVLWASILVNVLLVSDALGFWLVWSAWAAGEAAVESLHEFLNREGNSDLDIWHKCRNEHGLSDRASDLREPTDGEVGELV